ncbi:MAG: trypsin-like peptidase domain-containing protein [Planctomycetota bacterium]
MTRSRSPWLIAGWFLVVSCGEAPSDHPSTSQPVEPAPVLNSKPAGSQAKKPASASSANIKTMIENAKSKVFPALVTIYAFPEEFNRGRKVKTGGIGSGTIMTPEGHVITNAHVTQSAKKYICMLSNKEEVPATLVGEDYATDLAVLKLDLSKAKDFSPVPIGTFGKSSEMAIGDIVLAMGSPRGLSRSLTMGVMSNLDRQMSDGSGEGIQRLGRHRTGQYTNWLQHDASINPGNSGGPLVNLKGEVIGINELGGAPGMYFAIPSDIARNVFDQLLKAGKVVRCNLGFNCATIKDTGEDAGILVLNVDQRSPAGLAGLRAGDFIMKVNSQSVTARFLEDLAPFYCKASEVPVGQEVTLSVKRDGKMLDITYRGTALEDDWADEREFRAWGMTAANISPLLQRDAELPTSDGVFVTGVRDIASQIEPGIDDMVITQVGETPIRNLDDFAKVYAQYADRKDKYNLVFHYTNGDSSFLGIMKFKGEKDKTPEDIKRPWLGIDTQVLVTDLRRELKLGKKVKGVRITRIFPNTLAESSDFKVGDIITHVAGQPVNATEQGHSQVFLQLLQTQKVGETVEFTVLRGGAALKVGVKLEVAPRTPDLVASTSDKDFSFGVRDITFYDILGNHWEKDTKGLVVTEVDPHGWVANRLWQGDLILEIAGKSPRTIEEFKAVMDDIKKEKPKRVRFLLRRGNATAVAYTEPEWE